MTTSIQKKESGYRWVILASNTALIIILGMALTTWSVAIVPLSEVFNLGTIQILLGASIFVAGYTIGGGLWGELMKKHSFKKVGMMGLFCMFAGQLAIPLVNNWYAVLALRFIMGMGLIAGPLSYINGIWFSTEQRGLAGGILLGGLPAGFALGGLWAGYFEPLVGWSSTFTYLAFLILLGAIQWILLTKNPPEVEVVKLKEVEDKKIEDNDKTIAKKSVYGETVTYFIALTVFANFFQIYGMNSIIGVYLGDIGYDIGQIGTLVFALGIIGFISTPIGGIVSDIYVRKAPEDKAYASRAWVMAFGGFLVSAIGCFLVPFLAPAGFAMAIFGMLIVGWGIPWTNAQMTTIPIDIFGAEQGGQALGAMILIGGVGGVISPLLIAWIGMNMGWTTAWFLLGILSASGVLACGLIAKWEKS
jgi:MFS family permease